MLSKDPFLKVFREAASLEAAAVMSYLVGAAGALIVASLDLKASRSTLVEQFLTTFLEADDLTSDCSD